MQGERERDGSFDDRQSKYEYGSSVRHLRIQLVSAFFDFFLGTRKKIRKTAETQVPGYFFFRSFVYSFVRSFSLSYLIPPPGIEDPLTDEEHLLL